MSCRSYCARRARNLFPAQAARSLLRHRRPFTHCDPAQSQAGYRSASQVYCPPTAGRSPEETAEILQACCTIPSVQANYKEKGEFVELGGMKTCISKRKHVTTIPGNSFRLQAKPAHQMQSNGSSSSTMSSHSGLDSPR